MNKRPTIIDFINKYTSVYADDVYLWEKINDKWMPTTYAQTRAESIRLAAGLMSLGVEKSDKISLLSEGRNLWIIGECAMFFAGAINVPLSIKLSESKDLIFRINHSESKYIVVSAIQLTKIRKIIDQLPTVKRVIVLDDIADARENEITISQLYEMGDKFLAAHPNSVEERSASIMPDDVATISYTSGTTADPKGIMLTHRNYTANVEQGNSVISLPRGSKMLIILPLDHCFAHVAGMYTMMMLGGNIATVPVGKGGAAILRNIPVAIREYKPNAMLSVPSLAKNFKNNLENGVKAKGKTLFKIYKWGLNLAISYNKEGYNRGGALHWWKKPIIALFDKLIFSQLRQGMGGEMKFFVGGGALLDIDLQRYFYAIGIPMYQGYGLSEATPIISANAEAKHILGSSGKVVSPMDIKICDEAGNELGYGEKGEIVIRGENVMAGYWKNPDATEKTVIDGWLHTGDMGYMKDAEMLYVVGRFKSLLISSDGEKYSPEGIEESLAENSKFVLDIVLHNAQDPYTIAILSPAKDALREYVKSQNPNIDLASEEAGKIMLDKLYSEIAEYRKGGKYEGIFPERWLPSQICVAPEPFTEQNGMVNSTMKVVRNKVEKAHEDLMNLAYSTDAKGKEVLLKRNIQSLIK
jgi:long-chain acyl-CoA synthetase